MKFCKYCGFQMESHLEKCPSCGKNVGNKSIAGSTTVDIKNKKIITIVVFMLVVIVGIFFLIPSKCQSKGCKNRSISGTAYCYSHKCVISNCTSDRFSYSNYCYRHYLLYDDEAIENSKYVSSSELKISNLNVYTTRNYTYAEGTITNNGDYTVSFVEIKGAFKDYSGNVIDTDWTYAVGSEGLAPGESCKWTLSVDKDWDIEDCSITILDFDY